MPPLRPVAGALVLAIAAAAPGYAAQTSAAALAATTVVVQNCNDSGPGSLRAAYANAIDNETIDLSQLVCSRITLGSALVDPPTASSVRLTGPGRDKLAIDGAGLYRVLLHRGSGYLLVDQLTITNGFYHGRYGGGCIRSEGAFEATDATITGCRFEGTFDEFGGAIFAHDFASLFDSTVSESSTAADLGNRNGGGGGIYARGIIMSRSTVSGNSSTRGGGVFVGGGIVDVGNSTLSGNHATYGGALYARSSSGTISNSTISGNEAAYFGGGVYAYGPLGLYNCTISANRAVRGGAGVFVYEQVVLRSSIVANNLLASGLVEADVSGKIGTAISGAQNLVMASTLTLPQDTITIDPKLGPLQDNGGPTLTHALLPGSAAIDHGSNLLAVETDQRGAPFRRVAGEATDIGAFERSDVLFADGFEGLP